MRSATSTPGVRPSGARDGDVLYGFDGIGDGDALAAIGTAAGTTYAPTSSRRTHASGASALSSSTSL
jgi:hypothetical protein